MSKMGEQGRATRKILVACLGNPYRGDDGVGARVAQALKDHLPADIVLLTRAGDMLGLIEDWAGFDAVVCVDAAAVKGTPGRIHRVELARETLPTEMLPTSGHAFGLAEAAELARTLGCAPADIVIYAIEGGSFENGAPMTPEVASAAGDVAQRVIKEICRLQRSVTEVNAYA